MKTLQLWAGLVMYLGVGTILGATILLASRNLNTALGAGGILSIIGVCMFAFCVWKAYRAKRVAKD